MENDLDVFNITLARQTAEMEVGVTNNYFPAHFAQARILFLFRNLKNA